MSDERCGGNQYDCSAGGRSRSAVDMVSAYWCVIATLASTIASSESSRIAQPGPRRCTPSAKCSASIDASSASVNIISTSGIVWLGKWLTSTPFLHTEVNIVTSAVTSASNVACDA